MSQEILLKECIQLQHNLYDFILNILNLPFFIQNIQERLLCLEKENLELRQLLKKQSQAQNLTDTILSSVISHEFEQDIFIATKNGQLAFVQFLTEKFGVSFNKKAENNYGDGIIYKGDTPIHVASSKGHLPIVEYLIDKGANIEAKNNMRFTPLHIAYFNNSLQVVKYLTQKGANVEAKDENQDKVKLKLSNT